jgi:hypothetical protein
LAAVPGVLDVAVHTDPPFLGGGSRETFTVEDLRTRVRIKVIPRGSMW